jgi:3-deoxy-manno-octulosonate cytidylyltransferase (CMP-KDO synthetase)
MQVAIIIPARLGSTRFPKKPLALINGKEMIIHVCDRLKELNLNMYVATDSKEITDILDKHNYNWIMTKDCRTGTDRVYEASKKLNYDIFVNVQGDEPLVNIEDVKEVIKTKKLNMHYIVGTKSLLVDDDLSNKNIVKVGDNNEMTREHIKTKFKQCGIYAFSKYDLFDFANCKKQEVESIELTRISKYRIKFITITGSPSVDIPDDINKIQNIILGISGEA